MKKLFLIILTLFCLGWAVSCGTYDYSNFYSKRDTIINVGENGDSIFIVINEDGDTIDYWSYYHDVTNSMYIYKDSGYIDTFYGIRKAYKKKVSRETGEEYRQYVSNDMGRRLNIKSYWRPRPK